MMATPDNYTYKVGKVLQTTWVFSIQSLSNMTYFVTGPMQPLYPSGHRRTGQLHQKDILRSVFCYGVGGVWQVSTAELLVTVYVSGVTSGGEACSYAVITYTWEGTPHPVAVAVPSIAPSIDRPYGSRSWEVTIDRFLCFLFWGAFSMADRVYSRDCIQSTLQIAAV